MSPTPSTTGFSSCQLNDGVESRCFRARLRDERKPLGMVMLPAGCVVRPRRPVAAGSSRPIGSSLLTLNTIALELVPPNVESGRERAAEDARKVLQFSADSGIDGRIGHVMIPGMIAEEDDRPIEMKPKLDVLDFWSMIKPELPGVHGLCTQVTAFMDEPSLRHRLTDLCDAGMQGVVFVGVPRTMNDGEGSGVAPTDALSIYRELVTNRGVIVIPTRDGEQGRLNFKCDQGATDGMTQLCYSDAIVDFLTEFAKNTDHRPEILLSFGFVPKVESRIGLINWLIQDPGNAR